MMKRWRLFSVCVLMLVLTACSAKSPVPVPEKETRKVGSVRDLEMFPQDLTFYAGRTGTSVLLPPAVAQEQTARYAKRLFSVWSQEKPGKGNGDYFRAELGRKGSARGWAENLLPWTDRNWQQLVDNADMDRFPSLCQPAMTVRATSLRLAPTLKPRFSHPSRPGQGFPFDMFQQTALSAGFPVTAFHRSLDGGWLYVETALASGWVPSQDVAFVDEAFREQWMSMPLLAFVRDNLPLFSSSGLALGPVHIGTVLPLRGQTADGWLTTVPVRGAQGWAVSATAKAPHDAAVPMPMPLTARNVALVGNRLLEQPYGWGGMYGDRDCSAMMHDLFTPFGLWLPRNSAAQSKAGRFVSLEGLSASAKKALIRREGVPFLTLLWLPGHIGLYVGDRQGEPAFFHNMWGVRTVGNGRHIIGRAVVTSTVPGSELPDSDRDALLINRMKGMSILGSK